MRHRLPTFTGDRGNAQVSFVLLFPLAVALIMIVLQVVLASNARSVAAAAAQEGVTAARVLGGTPAEGAAAATQILNISGRSVIDGAQVSTATGPGTVTVRVTGTAVQLFPGITLDIDQSATGTIERFTPR